MEETLLLTTVDRVAGLLTTVRGDEVGIERDEFYIGELVLLDAVLIAPGLSLGEVMLTVGLPDGSEVQPIVEMLSSTAAHAEMETELHGWHQWRWATTGSSGDTLLFPDSPLLYPDSPLLLPGGSGGVLLPDSPLLYPDTPLLEWDEEVLVQNVRAAKQGRFRVLPLNV